MRTRAAWALSSLLAACAGRGGGLPADDTASGADTARGQAACPEPPTDDTPEPVAFDGAGAPYEKLTGLFALTRPEGLVGYAKSAYSATGETAIRRFWSADGGASWVEEPGCEVAPGTLGALDALTVGTPSVRVDDDGLWWMWYRADDADEVQRVLLATSPDGCDWTTAATPALEPGEDWAQIAVIGPHVLPSAPGGPLWMYYRGSNYKNQMWSDIGVASSPDGLAFEPLPDNPVFARPESGWDQSMVADPHVWRDGERWLMLYAGHAEENTADMSRDDVGLGKQIGLAVSDDGLAWRRCGDGPVLSLGRKADNAFALPDGEGLWVYARATDEADGSGGEIVRVWWPGWPSWTTRR